MTTKRFDELQLDMGNGTCDAYLARPEGEVTGGVLFISDIFGLRPQIRSMCERIAAENAVAVLAPNWVWRSQRPPLLPDEIDLRTTEGRDEGMQQARAIALQTPVEDTVADARRWFDVLAEQTGTDRFVVTGYCRGGMLSLSIAGGVPERVAGNGSFHAGGLVTEEPDSPHRRVGTITGEVLLRPADDDPMMTPEQQEQLAQALTEAGVRFDQQVYPGAEHGYTMADTWAYGPEAAERHYADLGALIRRTLA